MNQNLRIFLVEDDVMYADMMRYHLEKNPDYEIHTYLTGKEALDNLYRSPNVIITDFSLPDLKGNQLLVKFVEKIPGVPVIVISSQADINIAVELLKDGAFDYVVKDDNAFERLWGAVRNAAKNVELQNEIVTLRREIGVKYDFGNIVGESDSIKRVFELMTRAVKTKINVSVTGETGTGKELVAKAIHYNSDRKKKPFVAVNMAAIPKDLIESELFGHEKGAFTGAQSQRIGKFQEAHGGTIFLDEIGELELNLQAKILRVLQEGEITKIGSNKSEKIDVRVISATHKDLGEEVQAGRFREDLFYRVMGMPIELPPLRERSNDILILAKYFLEATSNENRLGDIQLTNGAKEKLMSYPFPGNVRELKSIIDLAAVMCNDDEIKDVDISFTSVNKVGGFLLHEKTMREFTMDILHHYLDKYNKDIGLVAQKLAIGKSTIYQMLKEEKSKKEINQVQ